MEMKRLLIATLLGALAVPLYAQADIPPVQTQGKASYISGGIGSDEWKQMERLAGSYPLALEFAVHATPRDEFTADVNVHITDAAGKTVLQTTSDGPFLLARLPPGRYTVSAQRSGDSAPQTRHVVVGKGTHKRMLFEWRHDIPTG